MKQNQESLTNFESEKNSQKQIETAIDSKLETVQSKEIESQQAKETRTAEAKKEALNSATSIEHGNKSETAVKGASKPLRKGPIGRRQLNDSYKKTIKQVQKDLPLGNRIFSKITHNPVIEKTSDIIGGTIAKPNAMLLGSIVAFVLTLATYTIAKKTGYDLSGSETIMAFIIGWTIGIIYDYLKVLFTGKK